MYNYEAIKLLGRGGQASVYQARVKGQDAKRYALKVFNCGQDWDFEKEVVTHQALEG